MKFAEQRTVDYDGVTYKNIPLVMTGIKEEDRRQLVSDHIQGLFLVSFVMYCAASDLGGIVPEKGMKITIDDGDFAREFYIGSSVNEFGMLRVELEAIDE